MALYSVNEVIEMAVQIEKNGFAFYQEATRRKDINPQTKQFLEYLRDEELGHEKRFLNLRDELDTDVLQLSTDWEQVTQYLKTIVDGRIFENEDSAIQMAAHAESLFKVVDNAIAFEKDTLLFFNAIAENVTSDKTKAVLRNIINEEVTHVLKLNDFKKRMA